MAILLLHRLFLVQFYDHVQMCTVYTLHTHKGNRKKSLLETSRISPKTVDDAHDDDDDDGNGMVHSYSSPTTTNDL